MQWTSAWEVELDLSTPRLNHQSLTAVVMNLLAYNIARRITIPCNTIPLIPSLTARLDMGFNYTMDRCEYTSRNIGLNIVQGRKTFVSRATQLLNGL